MIPKASVCAMCYSCENHAKQGQSKHLLLRSAFQA